MEYYIDSLPSFLELTPPPLELGNGGMNLLSESVAINRPRLDQVEGNEK